MPRIRPQSNNIKIKVSTQQTDDTVNVSTTNGTNPVKASNSMAEYWSNKSKEWAISENIVDNTDYSSKHYAELSKDSYDGIDELVNGFEQTVEDATTNAVQEISGAKDDAIADIIIEGGTQVNLVETTGGTLVTQMTGLKDQTLGYKNDAQSSANSASVSETNAHIYETNALSYSNSASGSASIATQKATEAASSAINASESELNALAYSNSANTSASNALTSESNASTSETNAQTYANNANTSATNAATSEDNANIWAEGSDAEVQALGGVHSSKGWAEESASGQVQSDYTESDSTKKSYIKNKPDLTVFVQKNGVSSIQTISLTSGTGTTALGIKSMATSSYISLSGSSGWLGSFGVTSNKRPAFYNGTGYTLAYTSDLPTKTSELTNDSGFIDSSALSNYATQTDLTNGLATKQDTLIAGTDLEIIPAQAPILPEGFTQIEYIEGTGTQYIDTGFYGTQNSGAYIRFALTDLTSEGSARVFGTRNGTAGTKAFVFISSYYGSSLPSDKFYIGSNGYESWPTNLDTNWHEVSCNIENDKKVYFDGNLIITGGNTAYTSTAQASIFRRYNLNTYSGKSATAKISILQIYENAVMVHNFIPCRRDSDDELGMYDLVSDTFFTNSGTGTFIAGPDTVFPETDLINFTNESGYIKGIDSTDVITALGYTPYDSTNPNGFTSNVGTVTSVNNTQPDANGNVALTIPTVNDGVLTITQNGTSKGTFSANQSTNDTIALTDTTYNAFTGADGTNAGSSGLVPAPSATDNDKYLKGDGTWASVSGGSSTDVQINGTSITSGGVANIVTNTAYNATSNKIATMSDLPADEIFIAEYNVTTYQQVLDAYNAGKTIFCVIQFSGYDYDYISSLSDIKQDLSEFCFNWTTGKPITLNGTNTPAYFNNCAIKLTSSSVWSYEYTAIPTINYVVKHLPSTSVGNSTTPVYIDSNGAAIASTSTVGGSSTPVYLNNGTITSTGLSIANSRFDGQWVSKHVTLADDVSMGNATIKTYSLASYLPDATYDYEVMFSGLVITASSSGKFLKMILDSSVVSNVWVCDARTRTSSTMEATGSCIIPISKNSQRIVMKSESSSNSSGTMSLAALAYRRIGTNT